MRSIRSSRVARWRYNEAEAVPSSAATRRMVTAANPSASATVIAAVVICSRLHSAGRPMFDSETGRSQIGTRVMAHRPCDRRSQRDTVLCDRRPQSGLPTQVGRTGTSTTQLLTRRAFDHRVATTPPPTRPGRVVDTMFAGLTPVQEILFVPLKLRALDCRSQQPDPRRHRLGRARREDRLRLHPPAGREDPGGRARGAREDPGRPRTRIRRAPPARGGARPGLRSGPPGAPVRPTVGRRLVRRRPSRGRPAARAPPARPRTADRCRSDRTSAAAGGSTGSPPTGPR